MSKEIAKRVAALYLAQKIPNRSKTASESPKPQYLPKPASNVSSWLSSTCDWLPDWPEIPVWQDVYCSETDQYHHTPTNPLRLRLRTCTGMEYEIVADIGVNLDSGKYEVISRSGATEVGGFPKEGHTLETILGWVGKDEYSERSVYLPNRIDPHAERWKSSMNLNVKYRILGQLTSLPL